MSRRRAAIKKQHLPDAKYGNLMISKFINNVMIGGKKSIAEKIVYDALEGAANKIGSDPVEIFEKVVANVAPDLEVRSRRVGGATYQVPVEVRPVRAMALATRWIIKASKARKTEKTMSARLMSIFIDSYNSKGEAVKKREDTHKMAEANRAFAHFRW
jgi:small subunit ribosomal protein S7